MKDTLSTPIKFYYFPTILKELINKEFGAVGSTDPTRWGCPAVLKDQKIKMLRPAYEREYEVWIRDGLIVFTLWKDTNVVCVASTVYSGNSYNQVKRD